MNGIDRIFETILSDAGSDAEQVLSQAQTAADALLEEGRECAERDTKAAYKSLESHIAEIHEKGRLASELESKKMLQAAKQKMIAKVFDQTLETLVGLPRERYLTLLERLAKDALADGLGGELMLNERDLPLYGDDLMKSLKGAVAGNVSLAPETAPIVGGLVIKRGKIELNCALDVLVRMLSEKSALEVANVLFDKGE
jgi:V/A-type H+-transporting ATPase subunit E